MTLVDERPPATEQQGAEVEDAARRRPWIDLDPCPAWCTGHKGEHIGEPVSDRNHWGDEVRVLLTENPLWSRRPPHTEPGEIWLNLAQRYGARGPTIGVAMLTSDDRRHEIPGLQDAESVLTLDEFAAFMRGALRMLEAARPGSSRAIAAELFGPAKPDEPMPVASAAASATEGLVPA